MVFIGDSLIYKVAFSYMHVMMFSRRLIIALFLLYYVAVCTANDEATSAPLKENQAKNKTGQLPAADDTKKQHRALTDKSGSDAETSGSKASGGSVPSGQTKTQESSDSKKSEVDGIKQAGKSEETAKSSGDTSSVSIAGGGNKPKESVGTQLTDKKIEDVKNKDEIKAKDKDEIKAKDKDEPEKTDTDSRSGTAGTDKKTEEKSMETKSSSDAGTDAEDEGQKQSSDKESSMVHKKDEDGENLDDDDQLVGAPGKPNDDTANDVEPYTDDDDDDDDDEKKKLTDGTGQHEKTNVDRDQSKTIVSPDGSSPYQKNTGAVSKNKPGTGVAAAGDDAGSSSHFMMYFITAAIVVVLLYIVYHKRNLLFALLLEGRRGGIGSRRRRVISGTEYKPLSAAEEALPDVDGKKADKSFVY